MSSNNEAMDVKGVFFDLKRRVKLTRKARIHASKRLRKKHEFYEKVTHFYSILILVLSIWFISGSSNEVNNLVVTKLLLILSLSLTFLTMYLNTKNYKERASAFESNYMSLDILLNRMERLETNIDEINDNRIKELHREYEKLLIEKENHNDIDYMLSSKENEAKFKLEIKLSKFTNIIKNILIAIYPLILLCIIFSANYFLKFLF